MILQKTSDFMFPIISRSSWALWGPPWGCSPAVVPRPTASLVFRRAQMRSESLFKVPWWLCCTGFRVTLLEELTLIYDISRKKYISDKRPAKKHKQRSWHLAEACTVRRAPVFAFPWSILKSLQPGKLQVKDADIFICTALRPTLNLAPTLSLFFSFFGTLVPWSKIKSSLFAVQVLITGPPGKAPSHQLFF